MPLPDFLIDRYKNWKNQHFKNKKNLYEKLAIEGQSPNVMVISCCDSRINPTSIFMSDIGELFIHRNIANLVPAYRKDGDHSGTWSAIEYAVVSLEVKDIIILGHSNCGGIKHSYERYIEGVNTSYQFINKWLEILKPIYKNLNPSHLKNISPIHLEKKSIVNSLKNIKSFPIVESRINENKLRIHGVWQEISSGNLEYYNKNTNNFEEITYL